MSARPTIAVDFDGCICRYAFPECGEPNAPVVELLQQLRRDGWRIIIHSSRVNGHWSYEPRVNAIADMAHYLLDHDVPFDEIWGIIVAEKRNGELVWSDNPSALGKPVAHVYLDDRSLMPSLPDAEGRWQPCTADLLTTLCRRMYVHAQGEYERCTKDATDRAR